MYFEELTGKPLIIYNTYSFSSTSICPDGMVLTYRDVTILPFIINMAVI
jgi:hypothetical protein